MAAALSETKSRFALAEALALDIPARPRGGVPVSGDPVRAQLEEAREKIIAAGGEERSAETLAEYRKTALWAFKPNGQGFQWVPGAGFTAHKEACHNGLTRDQLAALPRKRVNDVLEAAQKAPKYQHGRPEDVIRDWRPEQRERAVDELTRLELGALSPGAQRAITRGASEQAAANSTKKNALAAAIIRFRLAAQTLANVDDPGTPAALDDAVEFVQRLAVLSHGSGGLMSAIEDYVRRES